MTEAETIEVIAILGANSFSIFSVYLSITFAYLTVAYFVGTALNSFQVWAVSGLFVASAGVSSIACVGTTETWVNLIKEQPSIINKSFIYGAGVWDTYMAILLLAGMGVSLYFMYEIRRRARKNEESA